MRLIHLPVRLDSVPAISMPSQSLLRSTLYGILFGVRLQRLQHLQVAQDNVPVAGVVVRVVEQVGVGIPGAAQDVFVLLQVVVCAEMAGALPSLRLAVLPFV